MSFNTNGILLGLPGGESWAAWRRRADEARPLQSEPSHECSREVARRLRQEARKVK